MFLQSSRKLFLKPYDSEAFEFLHQIDILEEFQCIFFEVVSNAFAIDFIVMMKTLSAVDVLAPALIDMQEKQNLLFLQSFLAIKWRIFFF